MDALIESRLDNIRDELTRDFTRLVLEAAPVYFKYAPASSSGKYHPPDERGDRGLIIHTDRVCEVAEVLFRIPITPFSPLEQDSARSSCILHDICHKGTNDEPLDHTVDEHPELAAQLIKRVYYSHPFILPNIDIIIGAVKRHMGKWGNEWPMSDIDRLVHTADMIASQYIPIIESTGSAAYKEWKRIVEKTQKGE